MLDDRAAATVSWLESFDASLAPTVRPGDGCVFLDLPRPPSADYSIFRDFVRDIISHDSRVTQRRGSLFHCFTCEVLRAR